MRLLACISNLVLLPLAVSCIVLDNPFDDDTPPTMHSGGDDPTSGSGNDSAMTCQQAIQLATMSCHPPANLEITIDGASSEVISLDDPNVTVAANVVVASAIANANADFFARVFLKEPSCTVQCIYPCTAASQNMCAEISVAGGCIACTEDAFSLQECADFVAACDPNPAPPSDGADSTGYSTDEGSSSGTTTAGS